MAARVIAGKWSSLEQRSLSIALLDWTIKQKMGGGSGFINPSGFAGTLFPGFLNVKKLMVNYFYDIKFQFYALSCGLNSL